MGGGEGEVGVVRRAGEVKGGGGEEREGKAREGMRHSGGDGRAEWKVEKE